MEWNLQDICISIRLAYLLAQPQLPTLVFIEDLLQPLYKHQQTEHCGSNATYTPRKLLPQPWNL
jgi:hypothetical protein